MTNNTLSSSVLAAPSLFARRSLYKFIPVLVLVMSLFHEFIFNDQTITRIISNSTSNTSNDIHNTTSGTHTLPPAASEAPGKSQSYPQRHSWTNHTYGGSVTAAEYLPDNETYSNRLAAKLWEDYNINVTVHNNGIPASGPEHWNKCGIQYADIAISEFRLNEDNHQILRQWYDLLQQDSSAKHVVVLDLWSWLVPPGRPSKCVSVLKNFGYLNGNNSKFSLVDTNTMDRNTWRSMIKDIFVRDDIGPKCYESVFERNQTEQEIIKQCRRDTPGSMQHGPAKYHDRVATLLADHIGKNVIPVLDVQTSKVNNKRTNETINHNNFDRVCVGIWGGMKGDRALPWDTPGIILNNTGFHLNCDPTNRKDKISLNTNATFASNASLVLTCPDGYANMTIGIYTKTLKKDQATFTVNGNQMSSAGKYHNLRKYTKSFAELPLNISNVKLASPTAYLEITDIACKKLVSQP